MDHIFQYFYPVSILRSLTSSIFLWMSCSWSSHSCISESKLSISSGLSCPQPRPPCSSPRSRSMAAMTQATQYPEDFKWQFPLSPVSLSCQRSPSGCQRGVEGSMVWNHYKDKYMGEKEGWHNFLEFKRNPAFGFFTLCFYVIQPQIWF